MGGWIKAEQDCFAESGCRIRHEIKSLSGLSIKAEIL
jgi:hypothetical protein